MNRNEDETMKMKLVLSLFNDTEVNRWRSEWQHEVYLLTYSY